MSPPNKTGKKEKDVFSVLFLLEKCKEYKDVFPTLRSWEITSADGSKSTLEYPFDIDEVISELEKKVSEYSAAIINLKTQRNKVFAHNDAEWFLSSNTVEFNYPVQWKEIEDILSFAAEFLNQISLAFTNATIQPHFINADDVRSLLFLSDIGVKMKSQYLDEKWQNIKKPR